MFCVLDTIEKIEEIIEMLEHEANTLSQSIQLYENDDQHTYTREWIVRNWQINHDIDKLRALAFDTRYNKSMINTKARDRLAAKLQEKYQVA